MQMIHRIGRFVLILVATATVLGAAEKPAPKSSAPVIPGINAPDKLSHGCLDCHANPGANGKNMLLPPLLKAMTAVKHADVAKLVKLVPTDCAKCHKEGATKGGSLASMAHKAHLTGSDSPFIALGGTCMSCHALDPKTGRINVKSAPANW
jgi:hypothetical protein